MSKQEEDGLALIDFGREQGEREKARKMAVAMIKDHMGSSQIAKYTGLSEDQIEQLRKKLTPS